MSRERWRARHRCRDGGARRASEYVCFFDEISDVEGSVAVQGQALDVGVRDGRRDGVGVCRRLYSRPESFVPAAMVVPHRVVRWSLQTIVIPT